MVIFQDVDKARILMEISSEVLVEVMDHLNHKDVTSLGCVAIWPANVSQILQLLTVITSPHPERKTNL